MRLGVKTIRETVERGMPKKQGKIIELPAQNKMTSEEKSEVVLYPPFAPTIVGRG